MQKLIIINHCEDETRVAITQDENLKAFYAEQPGDNQIKGDIYSGLVTSVDKYNKFTTVNFGKNIVGILPFASVNQKIVKAPLLKSIPHNTSLKVGMPVLVQIARNNVATKKVILTNFISIASRLVVLYPDVKNNGGISRKILDAAEQQRLMQLLEKILEQLNITEHSVLLRTAAVNVPADEIMHDLVGVINRWENILSTFRASQTPALIFRSDSLISKIINSALVEGITKIVVDSKKTLAEVKDILSSTSGKNFNLDNINPQLYNEQLPVFEYFNLESKINDLLLPKLDIDINTKVQISVNHLYCFIQVEYLDIIYQNTDDKALNANLLAAEAIAKQIMLRDIGGLIVINFVDMASLEQQNILFKHMQTNMREDKAVLKMLPLSDFGVMQILRTRLLGDYGYIKPRYCDYCEGKGEFENKISLSNRIMRDIKKIALKAADSTIFCILPAVEAEYLLNSKRSDLMEIENQFSTTVIIQSDYTGSQYDVGRIVIRRGKNI